MLTQQVAYKILNSYDLLVTLLSEIIKNITDWK